MHYVWMAVVGLIVGALAKFIVPGKDPGGVFVTMLIGIAGAILAGTVGRLIGLYEGGQSAGFVMSLVGAILLLVIYRMLRPKATPRHP